MTDTVFTGTLLQPPTLGEVVKALLPQGFAKLVQPIAASTITTDTQGLVAGEVQLNTMTGVIPASELVRNISSAQHRSFEYSETNRTGILHRRAMRITFARVIPGNMSSFAVQSVPSFMKNTFEYAPSGTVPSERRRSASWKPFRTASSCAPYSRW